MNQFNVHLDSQEEYIEFLERDLKLQKKHFLDEKEKIKRHQKESDHRLKNLDAAIKASEKLYAEN